MSWETQAVPPPAGLAELLLTGNTEKYAIETFHQLDTGRLDPLVVPRVEPFQDLPALKRWQGGAPMPEALAIPFSRWLRDTTARTDVVSENERRLRSTAWAQWRLRGTDYEQHFVDFHRTKWGIDNIEYDSADREMQVQARARHGVV